MIINSGSDVPRLHTSETKRKFNIKLLDWQPALDVSLFELFVDTKPNFRIAGCLGCSKMKPVMEVLT